MLLPTPNPDELFVSVLTRLGRLNGFGDFREIAAQSFEVGIFSSFIDATLNLPKFCKHLGDAYGDPEVLLNGLTCLGARRFLGEIDEEAWRALICGDASTSIGALTFLGATELRFCHVCRKYDIGQYGVAYWHRRHQIPVLHHCATHGCRLMKVAIKRASIHESFPLPGDILPGQEIDLPYLWTDRFEHELAAFSEFLLTPMRPHHAQVEQVLRDELRERRLMNRTGVLRTNELLEHLISSTCSENAEDARSVAAQILRGLREPARGLAFGRAALLNSLLGDWRTVLERCNWLQAIGPSVADVFPDAAKQDVPDVTVIHRKKCLAYISSDPAHSRLGFTKNEYRSFRWLLHHDKAWLDHLLPTVGRSCEQIELF